MFCFHTQGLVLSHICMTRFLSTICHLPLADGVVGLLTILSLSFLRSTCPGRLKSRNSAYEGRVVATVVPGSGLCV